MPSSHSTPSCRAVVPSVLMTPRNEPKARLRNAVGDRQGGLQLVALMFEVNVPQVIGVNLRIRGRVLASSSVPEAGDGAPDVPGDCVDDVAATWIKLAEVDADGFADSPPEQAESARARNSSRSGTRITGATLAGRVPTVTARVFTRFRRGPISRQAYCIVARTS